MTAARRVAIAASVLAWLYSWYVVRGVRYEYAGGDIGPMPPWLGVMLVGSVLLTLGSAVAAWMRAASWPWFAVAAALAMLLLVLAAQYGVMSSSVESFRRTGAADPQPVTLGGAARAALHARSPRHVAFVSTVPTVLVLAAATGWVLPRLSSGDDDLEAPDAA